MEKFNAFAAKKENLSRMFLCLQKKLVDLQEIGIDCKKDIEKIGEALEMIKEDRVTVVLVGAFSDGKTSVVAGWLNEKFDNMKIDMDESSDELMVYQPKTLPQNCVIVDTPGLHGNKEKDTGKKFEDITKEFVDRASLILYVVEAKNPIKESHIDSLKWLLKDLNKIETVIFVINKMDEVADYTDSEDFERNARIKKENLYSKLRDLVGLNEKELAKIQIVCISSDPDGEGFDFWTKNRDMYTKYSNISKLEDATNRLIQAHANSLITKTGADTIRLIGKENIDTVAEVLENLDKAILPEMEKGIERNRKTLEKTKNDILTARKEMREDLQILQKKLQAKLRGTTMDTIRGFVEDEIGMKKAENGEYECGYMLEISVNNITDKYYSQISSNIGRVENQFIKEYESQSRMIDAVEKGVKGKLKSTLAGMGTGGLTSAVKASIFAARDLIGKAGIAIKFKPWQVTNAANVIAPAIGPAVSVGFEVFEMWRKNKAQKDFEEYRNKVFDCITKVFVNIYNSLGDDVIWKNYAPQILEFEKLLKESEDACKKAHDRKEKFVTWKKDFEQWRDKEWAVIDAEFKEI